MGQMKNSNRMKIAISIIVSFLTMCILHARYMQLDQSKPMKGNKVDTLQSTVEDSYSTDAHTSTNGLKPLSTKGEQWLAVAQRLSFEENKGQIQGADSDKVRFVIKTSGIDVFILNTGIAYQYKKTHLPEDWEEAQHGAKKT